MTRANILLTQNGKKSVCIIDSSAYPANLLNILTHFEDWVSEWNELRINAEYVYEINLDKKVIRGWYHLCRDWSNYSIHTALKKPLPGLIQTYLPQEWALNRDKSPIRFREYGVDSDGALYNLKHNTNQ